MKPPLLRFAPSPTGPLHLGGLRTALLNHLYAQKHGGHWILRIEDTDATRAVPGSVEGIRSGLAWAGLDYDFGPGKPGPHGPYFQSERLDLYHSYASRLLESGHAYRCFCSPTRLGDVRERLARSGSNSTYDKACLRLTDEEVARRVRAGESHVVRLNDSNLPRRATEPDMIFGKVRDAHASLPTDPILIKSDKFPTYHLANIADDHEMGITHVIRGEEWLLSLPLHLDLYAALDLQPPLFAHLPLLLNPDGTKMSKRHGNVRVQDYIDEGWEPSAVLNWLGLAGWGVDRSHEHDHSHNDPQSSSDLCHAHPPSRAPDSTAVFTVPEMIQQFDLSFVTHRRSVLDPSKLLHLNKVHLGRIPASELASRAQSLVTEAFPDSPHTSIPYITSVLNSILGRLPTLSALPTHGPYFFVDPPVPSPKDMSAYSAEHVLEVVRATRACLDGIEEQQWTTLDLSSGLRIMAKADPDLGGMKVVMTVLRIAISGMKSGPPVPETMAVIGRERTLNILDKLNESLGTLSKEPSEGKPAP
ncbi:hypothetical protein OF83DRAFT_1099368 [Amylostereum chailletii]|nr:hypothetical protein OF83DRAFT_1099368 [Amylostereum chailletii]